MSNILAPLLIQSKSFPLSLVAHPFRASCDARSVRDNQRMNDIDKKKAKVTPEQLEECRKPAQRRTETGAYPYPGPR